MCGVKGSCQRMEKTSMSRKSLRPLGRENRQLRCWRESHRPFVTRPAGAMVPGWKNGLGTQDEVSKVRPQLNLGLQEGLSTLIWGFWGRQPTTPVVLNPASNARWLPTVTPCGLQEPLQDFLKTRALHTPMNVVMTRLGGLDFWAIQEERRP